MKQWEDLCLCIFSLSFSDSLFFPRRVIWRREEGLLCFVSLEDCPYSLSFPLVELLGIGSQGVSELIHLSFSLSSPFGLLDMGVGR